MRRKEGMVSEQFRGCVVGWIGKRRIKWLDVAWERKYGISVGLYE